MGDIKSIDFGVVKEKTEPVVGRIYLGKHKNSDDRRLLFVGEQSVICIDENGDIIENAKHPYTYLEDVTKRVNIKID